MKNLWWSASLPAILARFSISGVIATLTYLVVANALTLSSSLDPRVISILAYFAGMIISFVAHAKFTFRVRSLRTAHGLRFMIMSALGLALSYYTVDVFSNRLSLDPFWGYLTASVITPMLNFTLMKLWVYRDPETGRTS